jgi:hypothetical protein
MDTSRAPSYKGRQGISLLPITGLFGAEWQVAGKDIVVLDFSGYFSAAGKEYGGFFAAGDLDTIQHFIDKVDANGGAAVLAHTFFNGQAYYTSANIIDYTNPLNAHRAIAIEVPFDALANAKPWDDALKDAARNHNIFAIASDDGHDIIAPGNSAYLGRSTFVWVEDDTLAALESGIRAGRMVMSNYDTNICNLPRTFCTVNGVNLTIGIDTLSAVSVYGVSVGTSGTEIASEFAGPYTLDVSTVGGADAKYVRMLLENDGKIYYTQAIKIKEDGTLDAETNPYQNLPVSGHWVRVNTHCHSIGSDGELDPILLRKMYADDGYDALVITDHNRFTVSPELWPMVEEDQVSIIAAALAGGYSIVATNEGTGYAVTGIQADTTENPATGYRSDKGGILGIARKGAGGKFGGNPSISLANKDTNIILTNSNRNFGVAIAPIDSGLQKIFAVLTNVLTEVFSVDKYSQLVFRYWKQFYAGYNMGSGATADFARTAGVAWYTGQAAYVDGTGKAALAQANADATAQGIGLLKQGEGTASTTASVVTSGCVYSDDWTNVVDSALLTPGATYFISNDAAGKLVTARPAARAKAMGIALSTKTMLVNPDGDFAR